ncbi:tumor necrosis factor receptor superfamily member 10A-like [Choloepus didactylus]|uniref:tumor necrosis factor receptor superfamily member 10A-like n=1 Tax=Choloepus didactylus TaxID=27675 RepID=UPI00189FEC1C|nr:tumor necrosis factor receptor superfamily member 10A-like [Choloepus didactylus]
MGPRPGLRSGGELGGRFLPGVDYFGGRRGLGISGGGVRGGKAPVALPGPCPVHPGPREGTGESVDMALGITKERLEGLAAPPNPSQTPTPTAHEAPGGLRELGGVRGDGGSDASGGLKTQGVTTRLEPVLTLTGRSVVGCDGEGNPVRKDVNLGCIVGGESRRYPVPPLAATGQQAALCALGPRRPGLTLAGGGLGLGPEALQGLERSVGLRAPPPGAPAWGTRAQQFRQMRTMFALAALALSLLLLRVQMTATPAPPHLIPTGSREAADPLGCGPHEYWTAGRCCRPCPPGHHVSKPCRSPHTRGRCEACAPGTFTAHPNGLPACLPCSTCSQDQLAVQECSAASDRRCQCQDGRFHRAAGSEGPCRRCSTCPKGMAILQKCNATADTVCGEARSGGRHHLCVMGGAGIPILAAVLLYFCSKRRGGERCCVGCQPPWDGCAERVTQTQSPRSPGQARAHLTPQRGGRASGCTRMGSKRTVSVPEPSSQGRGRLRTQSWGEP